MDEVRFLRIGEVAELLRISRTKVYELMASGQIPTLHLGRSCRVPLAALRDWIDEQTEQAAPVHSVPPARRPPTRSTPASATPAPRTRRTVRPRPPKQTTVPKDETTSDEPFFKPWMPRPMQKGEYQAWVAHLNAHPDEKALALEAIERYDASR